MAKSRASKVLLSDDGLELLINRLKVVPEEVWFDLGESVKLDDSVFEHGFILLGESLGHYLSHEW